MKKQLLILCAAISIFVVACTGKPGNVEDTSGSANTPVGGGSAHVDSLKTIGTGVNGQSSNTQGAKDTIINGHSVASPTDSAQKKKP
jgi:hypothetical protein